MVERQRDRGHARHDGHGRGRVLSAVALAGVAGFVATTCGCAGTGGAAADERAAGDGTATVRGAAGALIAAGSARAATSMEMAAGGTRVTIRGRGGYDFRGRMGSLTVSLPKDPAGSPEHRPITELLSPSLLYMKNRGAGVPTDKWVRIDSTALQDGNLVTGGATDPLTAAELLRTAEKVTYSGTETLAGTTVRHYRGVADLGTARRGAPGYARGALDAAAKGKGFATTAVPFDAYLDDEGRLRKVRQRFSYLNQGSTVTVASTTLLYDFGTPVAVKLPPKDDIYAGRIKE
ncbi:hypothetical protein [Streptomyces fuscigenes]|uniref:hypothetical protein n=1 Tax=Streptomyces fuscigenes TaxID=1528880 RepID=UPI001F165FC6|nr:hypothetical protein [Streptomyces fuscigenes]MCF3960957.1 hypothetical protein [Streptomyces fuscigenes]